MQVSFLSIYFAGCFHIGARGKNRLRHAVDDFFVRRANGRQNAAQIGPRRVAIAGNKIIRTQPHPSRHRDELVLLKIEPLKINEARLLVALENMRRCGKTPQGVVHRRGPIGVGKVVAEINAARAPGLGRKAGTFKINSRSFCDKPLSWFQSVRLIPEWRRAAAAGPDRPPNCRAPVPACD